MSLSTATSGTSDIAVTQSDGVTKKRIVSIDVMRGLVILLMAVDHVRERFFYHLNVSDPDEFRNDFTGSFLYSHDRSSLCTDICVPHRYGCMVI